MMCKQTLLDLMNDADAVYLATVDGAIPRIRAMVNLRRQDLYPAAAGFCRAAGFTVYMTTSQASSKARELMVNPNASVYFCSPREYHSFTLTGKVKILTDPDLKKQLWCDDWRVYWPEGAGASDYVVLQLSPVEAEGWWENEPFRVELNAL